MDEKDERWQDLAELLGLPPEKQAAPSKPSVPPARAEEKAPKPERVEPPSMPPLMQESGRMEAIPEEGAHIQESDFERPEDATIVDEGPLVEDTSEAEEGPEPREETAGEAEDPQRRGKRRRRRGRRRGKDDRDPRDREVSGAARGPKDGEERPKREVAEDDFDSTEEDEEPASAPHSTPLAVEDTDFSNWSVPSWQEIVDSLYRPDR